MGLDLLAARNESSTFLRCSFIVGRKERQFIFFIPSNLKQTHQKAGLGKLLMKKKQDLKLSQSA